MGFTQTYGHVNQVNNVEGTLNLTQNSDAGDLAAEIARIREEIARQPELPPPDRQRVEAELAAAEAQATTPQPSGTTIKGHLDNAATALQGAAGVADSAGRLAKTLVNIGKWAVTAFA